MDSTSFVVTYIWVYHNILSQVICCCTLDMTCYIFICISCLFFFKSVLSGACSYTVVV